MKISKVEAIPVSLPRDLFAATGTAGSPSVLASGGGQYKWSTTVPAVYSERIESTLVKVTLADGRIGFGEAQAPVAPRVSAAIVDDILSCVLENEEFDGTRANIEHHWQRMYQSMRVRGQTGGFMLDAISGVDLALWDLAGKMQSLPVAQMIAGSQAKTAVPLYLSGLSGACLQSRCAFARQYFDQGVRAFKIFYDGAPAALLSILDALRGALGPEANLAVDALWRLEWPKDAAFIEQLAERRLYWLEAPFMPDDPQPHRELKRAMPDLPIALGESYRTRREMQWFLDEGLAAFVQPDLGRSGITESLRIAATPGVTVVPHVSIALGPQIAAAIHLSAALANSPVCEFNPTVFASSNNLLQPPLLHVEQSEYHTPTAPGLGITPK